jgi:hypothetical protein
MAEEAKEFVPRSPEEKEKDFQRRLGLLREERAQDLAEGRERGEQLFKTGTLGRVDSGRAGETQQLIAERRAGLGGLTSQEQTLARERALQGVTEQSQTELARTRAILGRQNRQLDDPSAVAQQRRILERSLRERGNVERDLLLANTALQEQRRQGLENLTGQAQASELARSQINAQRQQQELSGQLQTQFGIAGLGSQERFGLRQLQEAEEQASQAQAFQQESLRLQEKSIDKPPPPAPSGGGGSVVCTALNAQGIISDRVIEGDELYAVLKVSKDTLAGYWYWGKPLAGLVSKSKLITKICTPFAKGWAEHAAYKVGFHPEDNWVGRVIEYTALPICNLIGRVLRYLGVK